MNISNISKYRREIDGLKAFAVCAVITYHLNKEILPSGYLGVDIYFVISGYLIISSIDRREIKDFFHFLISFYQRRINRIFPALIFFVLVFSLLICFFNPNPQFSLRTGLSSLFGLSNIYLFKNSTDYFSQSIELNLFMHLWSINVLGQFYIFFPYLIWFTGFRRKIPGCSINLTTSLFFLIGFSFVSYNFFYNRDQSASYFLMPTRLWEIIVGCLAYLFIKRKKYFFKRFYNLISSISFFLILGLMYLPISFNFTATVLIVFCTALLICSLQRGTFVFNIFTNDKIVYIGVISYSLYLWHWGVISISNLTLGIHWWTLPFQIGIMLYLSSVSYEYLEKPTRVKNCFFKNRFNLLKGILNLISVIIIVFTLQNSFYKRLFVGNNIENKLNIFKRSDPKCSLLGNKKFNKNEIFQECFFKISSGKKNFFWLGDKNTYSFFEGAKFVSKNTNSNFFIFSAEGTSFPSIKYFRLNSMRKNIDSHKLFKYLEEKVIIAIKKGDIIFINMRLPYYFIDNLYEHSTHRFRYFDEKGRIILRNSKRKHFEEWLLELKLLVDKVSKKNAKIVILGPTPEFPYAIKKLCKEQNAQWFNKLAKKDCSYPLNSLSGENGDYYELIFKTSNFVDRYENLFFFNPLNSLCPNSICNYSYNGNLLYRDEDQITEFASRRIVAPSLLKFLEENHILLIK